jgi:hypothetical protein
MNLSTDFILEKFAHVFSNEFNERKIIHSVVDEGWGKSVSYHFVTSGSFSGTNRNIKRANDLRDLARTLVLTKDTVGNYQLFSFWLDFTRNQYGYSEIKKESIYVPFFKRIYK